MPERLLIIDDDQAILDLLETAFEDHEFKIYRAMDSESGLAIVKAQRPNVAIVDIGLPGKSGLEILKEIKLIDPQISVIITTGDNTTQNAIEAMKFGAYDYLLKPFDLLNVQEVVDKGLASNLLSRKVIFSSERPNIADQVSVEDVMIGASPEMVEIWKMVGKVAASDATVLITGDSGTGKELLARAIFTNSNRKNRPFLAVNCAALPENLLESELFGHEKGAFTDAHTRRIGKFEQCNGGTLFLDEISEMSLLSQGKLLRVLENQIFQRIGGNEDITTDVRIIAASNRSLLDEVKNKQFRLDLFYRLRVVQIHLPALHERQEDIPLLIDLFVKQSAFKYGKKNLRAMPEVVKLLSSLPWEGNIRELRNAISAAVIFSSGNFLQPHDFGQLDQLKISTGEQSTSGPDPLHDCIKKEFPKLCNTHPGAVFQRLSAKIEQQLVQLAMIHCRNNQVAAAKLLGISRNTLRKRLEQDEPSI